MAETWDRPCAQCRHSIECRDLGGDRNTWDIQCCTRTGWSVDYERSASGSCGEDGKHFEKAERIESC
jgi:hypothetical protein